MSTRTFLLLGSGSIGKRHLRNLKTLGETRLLAWDPSAERRAEVRDELAVEAVATVEEGLAAGANVALVCSPTAYHGAQVSSLVSHCDLFVEKPLAVSYKEAIAARDAVEAAGHVCLVACNLRFHPGLIALRRELDAGSIGRLLCVRAAVGQYLPDWHPWEDYRRGYSAHRALGGGIVLDAIHEIDVTRWLAGEFREVRAFRARVGDLEIDTEDVGALVGISASGVFCEVHMDYLQRVATRTCMAIGTAGTLVWNAVTGRTELLRPGEETRVVADFRDADPNAMYLAQTRHFLDCLDGKAQPAQTAREAAEAVRVAEQFEPVGGLG